MSVVLEGSQWVWGAIAPGCHILPDIGQQELAEPVRQHRIAPGALLSA